MSSSSEKQPPRLKETEYGYYIREKWRSKTKRTQETLRFPKNLEKVVIAKIGTLEIYVYPFQFPNQVFLGIYPINTKLSKHQAADLMRAFNTVRWYLNDEWTNAPGHRKNVNSLRRKLQKAYLHGEKNHENPKKRRKSKKKRNNLDVHIREAQSNNSIRQTSSENGVNLLIK